MIPYSAPIDDMKFLLRDMEMFSRISDLPGFEETDGETVDALLGEAGRLASEVLAPLNASGDRQGAVFENGVVRAPDGFADAYKTYVEAGWNSMPFDAEFGGQEIPWLVTTAVQEMWTSANMAWSLCPLLTIGAVEAITAFGDEAMKKLYLPKMISGEWAGTMNLTEPQAGSDLAELRCRAVPEGDHYRITGQKIFITWGEHDMAENIIHMMLARLPDAPPGVQGISLFLVPKVMVGADGALGQHNDLRCASVEHKLGIHASPTCVMAYGDNEGAVGYLVGRENEGLKAMFTMMNLARFNVGLQGVSIGERAYQQARDFARERVQGRQDGGGSEKVAIIKHPDVRRMLMVMKAQIEAMRAVAYDTSAQFDIARRHPDEATRRAASARLDLMTPIVKAWSTDIGVELTSMALQIHGGMGFIEETGIAQHMRDARIAPIYEGTNGIQARDLVGRKVLRDRGVTAKEFFAEARETATELADNEELALLRSTLTEALDALESATDWLIEIGPDNAALAFAGATPYLKLFGTTAGGVMMARAGLAARRALAEGRGDAGFNEAKLVTVRFYGAHVLPRAKAYAEAVTRGAESVLALPEDAF